MTLKEWLAENRYTYAGFAKLLVPHGIEVSRFAVQKWTVGHEPRRPAREAIAKVTRGKVRF